MFVFSTIVDFGSDRLRLGVFDGQMNDLFSHWKDIIEKENYYEYVDSIKFLIREAEKKISNHVENIIVLYNENWYSYFIWMWY